MSSSFDGRYNQVMNAYPKFNYFHVIAYSVIILLISNPSLDYQAYLGSRIIDLDNELSSKYVHGSHRVLNPEVFCWVVSLQNNKILLRNSRISSLQVLLTTTATSATTRGLCQGFHIFLSCHGLWCLLIWRLIFKASLRFTDQTSKLIWLTVSLNVTLLHTYWDNWSDVSP